MYEFWYDYIKPKYQNNSKLCYMDTGSFIVHIKSKDVYEGIANDVGKRFDTSNYEIKRPLTKAQKEKVIGLMKKELCGKVMTEFAGSSPKTYSYLIDEGSDAKKAKGTKKCVIKRRLKCEDYNKCLQNNKIILQSQQRFKSSKHNVFTKKFNKATLTLIIIRDYRLLMESHHIHMVQMLENYANQNCYNV